MGKDTIDITDLVEKTRSAFEDWAVIYCYTMAIAVPGFSWLALPVIKQIVEGVVRMIVRTITKSAVMQGFFLNTALRKATQSTDFVDASNALEALPDNVSDEEYEKYETRRMDAFRNFAVLSN